jgi:hypothetical protein
MRRAGRKDGTQAAIVAALRRCGCAVFVLNQENLPDLLVHRAGRWQPVEVKSPRGHLTAGQRQTMAVAPFPVVSTVAEALQLFGVMTND